MLCQNFQAQNLITNPSFEEIDSCYGNPAPLGFDVFQWTGCTGWSCPTKGSSDIWCANPIIGSQEPPLTPVGYQYPKSGSNYAGLVIFQYIGQNYREYLQNKLKSPLEKNEYYLFSEYISVNGDSINYSSCMQAYFSQTPVSDTNYDVLPLIPQWSNDAGNYLKDTISWQLVSGVFKATGGEQYLTIGCFDDSVNVVMKDKNPNTTSELYYVIDDVSLTKAPIEVKFPNVFTPNGDKMNDLFFPTIIGIPDFKVFIYNRWGNKMTVLDTETPSWDGKDATVGTYYYILESKHTKIREQGFFQLVR